MYPRLKTPMAFAFGLKMILRFRLSAAKVFRVLRRGMKAYAKGLSWEELPHT
jgi:hypothetical protein